MTIITEQRNPDTVNIDLMSSVEIARAINREDQKVAFAVEKVLANIAQGIDLMANAFLNGGRVAYFGAGTSGRIGVLDASEWVPTFSADEGMVKAYIAGGDKVLRYSVENAEDSAEFALRDLEDFAPTNKDVVVGISASGNPQYVITALEEAQKRGAKTIGITSNPKAGFAPYCDELICVGVGQEAITGSSRMKSGTAQKMVLNMLSTGAMIRIGKTYQNYMIDVKVSNKKLYKRGLRFISEICDVNETEAEKLLNESGKSVKVACVMKLKNCTKKEAEKMLSDAGGVLRKVIG
ncbi:MAG: N-acetylmuramic acid 6-phosphate etherase [Alphaproteobacteria bacterium]|nr:N-acetylmuramic acid 6-phosphate etherase [Alphaproteobacteria bacterium]